MHTACAPKRGVFKQFLADQPNALDSRCIAEIRLPPLSRPESPQRTPACGRARCRRPGKRSGPPAKATYGPAMPAGTSRLSAPWSASAASSNASAEGPLHVGLKLPGSRRRQERQQPRSKGLTRHVIGAEPHVAGSAGCPCKLPSGLLARACHFGGNRNVPLPLLPE